MFLFDFFGFPADLVQFQNSFQKGLLEMVGKPRKELAAVDMQAELTKLGMNVLFPVEVSLMFVFL